MPFRHEGPFGWRHILACQVSIAEGANAGSPRIFCAMMSLAVIFDPPNSFETLVEMFEISGLADIF